MSIDAAFERMKWSSDTMSLDGLHFVLEQCKTDNSGSSPSFTLNKRSDIMEQYRRLFAGRPNFEATNMLELGIFKGGSIALWREILRPKKIIALDILPEPHDPHLADYVSKITSETAVKTYWNSDQADKDLLRKIAKEDLDGHIDMVIDDATHEYEFTKTSFQTLFPFVRPGGLYIIEDWAWNHWLPYQKPGSERSDQRSPSELIFEITEATGTASFAIDHLEIYSGFVAVVRGKAQNVTDFQLDQAIRRRPFSPYKWAK